MYTGKGSLAYVYRPALLSGCHSVEGTCLELGTSEVLQLPGFGVELAIKNMEYSAMDDSKVGVVLLRPHHQNAALQGTRSLASLGNDKVTPKLPVAEGHQLIADGMKRIGWIAGLGCQKVDP